MKKLLSIVLLAFVALSAVQTASLAAVNSPEINIISKVLKVDGYTLSAKADRGVSIIVTNPGFTLSDVGSVGAVQYQGTAVTSTNGYFCFYIKLHITPSYETGDMSVFIGGDDFGDFKTTTTPTSTAYYATDEARDEALSNIIGSSSEADLEAKLLLYKRILGYDNALFNGVSADKLSEILFPKLASLNINMNTIQDVIEQYSLLTAYNQGKNELCMLNGSFLYPEALKLDEVDAKYDCTASSIYFTGLSNTGRQKVIESLFGKNFKSIEDFQKQFIKSTVALGINNFKDDGYAHIAKVLTVDNAAATDININKYFILSSTKKRDVDIALLDESINDVATLETVVLRLCEDDEEVVKVSSPRTVGGGGLSVSTPIPEQPVINIKPAVKFDDLSDNGWAEEAILSLYNKGIVSGVSENKYDPNSFVTREQLAKMVCVAFGIETAEDTQISFKDTESSMWYMQYIRSAYKAEIVKGISQEYFGINQNITRQDIAVIIYRCLDISADTENQVNFDDKNNIAEYAIDGVKALSSIKIINGFDNNTFRPNDFCTRAQAAKIIFEALKHKEVSK